MKIVKVFKTNVNNHPDAGHIIDILQQSFTYCKINFDLDDCDRILRVESQKDFINEEHIRLLIAGCGYHCEPLPEVIK